MDDGEGVTRQIQERSYRWSGVVDAVGRDLLIPWLNDRHLEGGSVWIPQEQAFELAAALIRRQPTSSEFVAEMMAQALADVVPDEYLTSAVRQAENAAMLIVEHAVSLAVLHRLDAGPAAKKPTGMTDVVPMESHGDIL